MAGAITAAPRSTPRTDGPRLCQCRCPVPRRRRRGCSAPSGGRRRCRSRRGASLRRRRRPAAEVFRAASTPVMASSSTSASMARRSVLCWSRIGDLGCLARVVGREHAGAEVRCPYPAAGIDPRSQDEAGMPRVRLFRQFAQVGQAVMPGLPRLAMILRPWVTRARLSPIRGTTSQTVPSATMSSQLRRSGARAAVVPPAGLREARG